MFYANHAQLPAAAYPFKPHAKTVDDHTLRRFTTIQIVTIKPPPVPAINGVAGIGSNLE